MFYAFLMIVAFGGTAIYLAFFLREVPGAKEQRLGELEPLPPDLGKWKLDEASEAGRAAQAEGLKRETRLLFDEAAGGVFRDGKLIEQVRYRRLDSNEIVRIEPERTVPRKRIKA